MPRGSWPGAAQAEADRCLRTADHERDAFGTDRSLVADCHECGEAGKCEAELRAARTAVPEKGQRLGGVGGLEDGRWWMVDGLMGMRSLTFNAVVRATVPRDPVQVRT